MTVALRDALTLDQARAAARSGDLDQAVRLLDGVATPTVAALDLRARVHAQRGELDRADACWEQVLALDPGHADARRGRETVARLRRRRPIRAAVITAVVAALAVGGVAVASTRTEPPSAAPPPSLSMPPSAAPPPSLSTPPSAAPPPSPTPSAPVDRLAAIAESVSVPGVRADRRADDVRVVFSSGVFSSGTRLADGAPARLRAVGKLLRTAGVTVTVIGHTVPVQGGRTSGGSTTAYARAQVAAQRLAAASGLPLTSFSLATADQSDGPWAEPARNRTVTLVLRPTG